MIKYNQTLVVIEQKKPKCLLTITEGQTWQSIGGAYHHLSLIDRNYGDKIQSKSEKGYIHLIQPTPSLITETIPHKTQILFLADISIIILKLNIKPGSIVIESGTGSASLSCSIASAVGHKGRLYTYEFNEDRAKNGEEQLRKLGFPQAECIWRDVYGQGFLKEDHGDHKRFPDAGTVDAVFLDLPQPWLALDHSKKMMKKGGKICCFSPCIEQVQKTCAKLKEDGWFGIETLECLKRNFEARVKQESFIFDDIQKKICLNTKNAKIQTEEGKQVITKNVYYSTGQQSAYGHTGYLTYAVFL
ncbi:hypothetical protein pb186bvf_014367 [Paramecium bursaria]